METLVLSLGDVDHTMAAAAGGKGAGLGALARMSGVRVPDGFCVSTEAYRRAVAEGPAVGDLVERLSQVAAGDQARLSALGAELRRVIEGLPIPVDVRDAVIQALAGRGERQAWAVRSSATAEDLPTASFAGQQETYLNVVGPEAVLTHVRRCWASLFTDRAIAYRASHGFDHRQVQMAVVVQELLSPRAAGVLFTADPVTSNRTVTVVEAAYGLGEALVSGRVDADRYVVRGGQIIARTIGAKAVEVLARADGGTEEQPVPPDRRSMQALTDEEIVRLERLGRDIGRHLGVPQDIEWCLVDDALHVVQSRPITGLYPVPGPNDGGFRVYVSVGHQQMMTDAMKPLGLSLWQATAGRPMHEAGGRVFVDVTRELSSAPGRHHILKVLGASDPLISDALTTIIERGDLGEAAPEAPASPAQMPQVGPPAAGPWAHLDDDPAIVAELIARSEASLAALEGELDARSGADLLGFIVDDVTRFRAELFQPRNVGVIMAALGAAAWLNEHMLTWLGEKNAADALSRSAPDNVTSTMGLELLDVADAIRPHPAVIEHLRQATDEDLLPGLSRLEGGRAAHDAISAFLGRYGARCVGEIDVTRPRWIEAPSALVPLLLGNVERFEPGARARLFEQGRAEAAEKERELLERLRSLPDGERKAAETAPMIRRLRRFIGYREYPKYAIASRYMRYRRALLRAAGELARAGVIGDVEDIHYLTLEELRDAARAGEVDAQLVERRRDEHERHRALWPPRVITSEGEVVAGAYRRADLPAGALPGLAVSSGVVEGRARVLLDLADAELEEGDILVTTFTDPSWTPVFLAIRGLVAEVGGLMTHGAVVAREYGLPAVVGVEDATRLIADGQRIRVHGTDGYVEILSP